MDDEKWLQRRYYGGDLPAEAERAHVANNIRQAGSDVDVTTDRSGRPYRLVCTKNQASHERRLRQRRCDLEDVAQLTA